jgi:hypothetical protein
VIDSPMESRTSYSLAVVAVGTALVALFAGACVIVAVGHEVPQQLWAAGSALSGALVGILIPTPGHAPSSSDYAADAASVTHAAATSAARDAAAAITEGPADPATKQAAKQAAAAVKDAPVGAMIKRLAGGSTPADVIEQVIGMFGEFRDTAQHDVDAARAQLPAAAVLPGAVVPPGGGPHAAAVRARVAKTEATHAVQAAAATGAANARHAAAAVANPSTPRATAAAFGVTPRTILLLAVAGVVLICAFVLAGLISSGQIHAAGCPIASGGKTQSCDSNLLQIGTAVLALASAAGGTLLGLFATPDGKPAPVGAASSGSK